MPTSVMIKGADESGRCVHEMASVDGISCGEQRFFVKKNVMFKDVENEETMRKKSSCFKNSCCSDESSSSIGKNSDVSESSSENTKDDQEVQSSYKSPFDAMDALEQVLPMRRGISRFYNGKSKSFASLADATSSSVKDLAKPENAFTRKRRNLLAYNIVRSSPLGSSAGGISKRVTSSGRTNLALAVAMSNSENDKLAGQCDSAATYAMPSPRKDFCFRSFSVADLQACASVGAVGSNPNQLDAKTSG